MLPHPLLQHQSAPQAPLQDGHPPVDGGQGVLRGDGLELEHGGPGEHCPEHVEKGVLRGGGNEGDFAVLHELQQGLLLLLVEILDLIQVKENSFQGHQGPDVCDDLFDVTDGRGSGVQPVQGPVGPPGDDVGHRGLSGTRGTVKDQVGDVTPLDDPAEQALPA